MATIKDIAKRLNISVSTVSYALNGGPRPVPDDVRDRVLATALELNYRPNRTARSLATGRTHTIGVVPTEPIRDLAGMAYFNAVFNGVVNAAEDTEQDVMLFTRADASRAEALHTLMDGRVDGLIVLSPHLPSAAIDRLVDAGVPFAVVATSAPSVFPTFGSDNTAGVRSAVEHLVALGHRRIGHLAGRLDMFDGADRVRAFRDAMAGVGLPLRETWIEPADFTTQGGEEAASRLFASSDAPTAIFAGNDESAYGLMRWAAANHVAVPQELSVVGFDDMSFASYLTPGLTTLAQPLATMGADALRAVLDLIAGRSAHSKTYDPHLVLRSSTAPLSKEGKS